MLRMAYRYAQRRNARKPHPACAKGQWHHRPANRCATDTGGTARPNPYDCTGGSSRPRAFGAGNRRARKRDTGTDGYQTLLVVGLSALSRFLNAAMPISKQRKSDRGRPPV
jgi:hypothetical protein